MTITASDIYSYFFREEFDLWRVIREDGKLEKFDSLTLIESFIESEMDLFSAFALFDKVVERITPLTNKGPITYDQIHITVVKCLLETNHPKVPFWLTNYENIFGPDLEELTADQEYIVILHASQLKKAILEKLAKVSGKGSLEELEKYLGTIELTDITNRLIKIVRYCGFYRVKKSFLDAFVEELAERSTKSILPSVAIDGKKTSQALDEAEKLLLIAREEARGDTRRSANLLETALEEIGAIALEHFGLFPLASSHRSFTQFIDVLKTVGEILKSNKLTIPQFETIKSTIISALEVQNIPLERLCSECEDVYKSLKSGLFLRATQQALRVLRNLRIILQPEEMISILRAYEFEEGSDIGYLEIAYNIFSKAGIPSIVNREGKLLDVRIDFNYHELIEFGRNVRFRAEFLRDEECITSKALDYSIVDLKSTQDIISVIITNCNLGKEALERLRTIAVEYHRCVSVISRQQFENVMRKPEEVRDLILTQFEALVPGTRSWRGKIFPEEKAIIPPNIYHYEKRVLEEAFAEVSKNRGSEGCMKAGRLLEFAVREQTLFICSILEYGLKRKTDWAGIAIQPGRDKVGSYIEWLRELSMNPHLGRNSNVNKYLSPFIPDRATINEIGNLMRGRNEYMHEERETDSMEARSFVSKVAVVIGSIQEQAKEFDRAIFAGAVDREMIFYTSSGVKRIRGGQSHASHSQLAPGCCVYLTDRKPFYSIIPALRFCRDCKTIIALNNWISGRYRCSHCNSKINLEGGWYQLLRRTEILGDIKKPDEKRKDLTVSPIAEKAPLKSEPTLGMVDYEKILGVIQKTGQMMEKSPLSFRSMGEEQLRDQFLGALNSHYEGGVSSESFNFTGKTDILVRVKDKNLFIAECKIWRGPGIVTEAINQLLGYTTWRDTKTAILLFNRNRNLSMVLEKIIDIVSKHPKFKRFLGCSAETVFRFVLEHRDDPNREMYLSILIFEMPE